MSFLIRFIKCRLTCRSSYKCSAAYIPYKRTSSYMTRGDVSTECDCKLVYIDKIDHVATAPGPLACPSRSARPRKCLNLTLP